MFKVQTVTRTRWKQQHCTDVAIPCKYDNNFLGKEDVPDCFNETGKVSFLYLFGQTWQLKSKVQYLSLGQDSASSNI